MRTTQKLVFAAICGCLSACLQLPCRAQEVRQESAVYTFFGREEDLSEEELLRIEALLAHPVRLNSAGRGELMDSGLFTPYQAASVVDYRQRLGDILSVTELSLVDGIGDYLASALAPFLSFAPGGGAQKQPASGSVLGRFQWKDGKQAWASRLLYKNGSADAALAARTVYSDASLFPPSGKAFYAGWSRGRLKVVAGSMNLRFGQGLAQWSGLSLAGVTSPLSLYKRGSPLSGSYSCSGTARRGLAATLTFGRFMITPFYCFSGPKGGNLTWLLPSGQAGLTATAEAVSADGRFCLAGKDVFAEACWEPSSRAVAALGGAVFPIGGRSRIGFQIRAYPKSFTGKYAGSVRTWSKVSDEAGLSLSFGRGDLSIAADAAMRYSKDNKQLKISASDVLKLSRSLNLKLRATARRKNFGSDRVRTDLRADLCLRRPGLGLNWRGNWVHSAKNGLLTYLEAAFERESQGVLWLRATLFSAEKWADRLYSYERDAPGSFLIPAYYGNGYALSAYMNWKLRLGRRSKLAFYLRASCTGYWKKKKPSVPEIRFATAFSF